MVPVIYCTHRWHCICARHGNNFFFNFSKCKTSRPYKIKITKSIHYVRKCYFQVTHYE